MRMYHHSDKGASVHSHVPALAATLTHNRVRAGAWVRNQCDVRPSVADVARAIAAAPGFGSHRSRPYHTQRETERPLVWAAK